MVAGPVSPHDGPVAVTGVSGFTGGHMVRELVHHGYKVRACVRDTSSWRGEDARQYLSKLPGVEIYDGCDLFTQGSYNDAFKGCSAVFHVAAVLGNSANGKSQPLATGNVAKDVYDGGLFGTENVLRSVQQAGSVKRVVYISSMAAVQGGGKKIPRGYEWSETDWSDDGVSEKAWNSAPNAYAKSKVDAERLATQLAAQSGGAWDLVTMNPAMISGPLLFAAQNGQWIEQLGRMASGLPTKHDPPASLYAQDQMYDIIDVRDLCCACRLAAESSVDHAATKGGARYCMHGSGGRSDLKLSTEVVELMQGLFPSFEIGRPATTTKSGKPIKVGPYAFNDSKKAKQVLGVTLRPVEETIRDVIVSSIELGIVVPKLKPVAKL